jgi:hypothetical protein
MAKSKIRSVFEAVGAFILIAHVVLGAVTVVLALALVTSPVWVPYIVARHLWLHSRNRGRVFLVVTRRHGWFEFVMNNVVPVLPPNVDVVWQESPARTRENQTKLHRLALARTNAKPYFTVVNLWRNEVIQLHSELEPLKRASRKRSRAVQARVSSILHAQLAG